MLVITKFWGFASVYNDCVPESTCSDLATDYVCVCGPGLTGDGRYKAGIH